MPSSGRVVAPARRSAGTRCAALRLTGISAALLAALHGAACRSVDDTGGFLPGNRGLPPFYEVYRTPSRTTDWKRDREGTETYIRPFGSIQHAEPDRHRLQILFPFLSFWWGAEGETYRVLPVFRHRSRRKLTGGTDSDTMIFPFFFWGSDSEEGGYFAFFPFGGRLRGLLAQNEIDFAMFPIWTQLRWRERTSTHILFPFFNTVSGEGWSGWRFWPFYGSYRWETKDGRPRSERHFVLWPLYIWGTEDMHRDPREVFFTVPFYGRRENSRSLTETYFWPFFGTHLDKRTGRRLYGGFAFPYRFTSGGDEGGLEDTIYQFDPWPFFGIKKTVTRNLTGEERRRFRQFALWPIQRYDRSEDDRRTVKRLWVLPVWADFSSVDKLEKESERSWILWPLCSYRREAGEVRFDAFRPLWFNREIYDRQYGRLFSIFRYRSRPQYSGWELLYGTLYWESRPQGSLFSVLGGLLELGRQADSFVIRVLYIPWW